MDEQQKRTRLILLGCAGLLLSGGIGGWVWYTNSKVTEPNMEASSPVVHSSSVVHHVLPTRSKAGAVGDMSKPNVPGVAGGPLAAKLDTARGRLTSKPNVAGVVDVAGGPLAAKLDPNQPNGRPLPSYLSKAPLRPLSNSAAATVEPANIAAATKPAVLGELPTGLTPTSARDAARDARAKAGKVDPMQPLSSFLPFPRVNKNGGDNLGAENSLVPPPPADEDKAKDADGVGATQKARQLAAKMSKAAKAKVPEELVPPPPPTAVPLNPMANGGLPVDQLPVPPPKPIIGDQVKILAVVDNKVIVTFPKTILSKNKWPKTMTLAAGQEFESIRVVSIGRDGITIEEDGERTFKPLPTIK